jgi:membrane protease YdiL (CAAX protease family)
VAESKPHVPLRAALVLYAALLAAAVLWRGVLCGEPLWFADAEAARAGLHPARDAALGAACGLAAAFASGAAERRTAWGRRLAAELAELVGPLSRGGCLALALASGVAEEAFFRGALQPRVGLLAASVLFGLAHLSVTPALRAWTALALASGLGLGLLFEATGSLVAPVTAHALVNALGLWSLSDAARGGARASAARP